MPLATKNGSLIVKDGQLAENCGCCGGWYCDGISCWRCNLTSFPPSCNSNWDSSCIPQYGCKTMYSSSPCSPTQGTVSVSGFGETVFNFCNPATVLNTTFSACNKTYSSNELCGYVYVQEQVQQSYELPWLLDALWHYGTFFSLSAGFTTRLASGASASPGYVVFRVVASAQVQYIESFSFINWQVAGSYQSAPLTIESLPTSGSWLSGRSVLLDMPGTYGTLAGLRCTIAPQAVSISFS